MNPRIFVVALSLVLSVLSADASFDYITVPPGADPSVSAEDGGNGFEKIAQSLGYQTHSFSDEDLKFFGDKRAVKTLVKALGDDGEDVRYAAKKALEKLGHELE